LMAFSATLEKHFRQQFSVGLALSYANTLDYDEATFQLYFRYQAKKRQPSEIVRIQPLSPFYRDGL
ncbi:MAG: BCSC C-terminal domain-containing protein, partial [Pseudomonadales bacterium]|nr:BCSC C-terminal domain-containing protein [Pseudomonadales bacterium]